MPPKNGRSFHSTRPTLGHSLSKKCYLLLLLVSPNITFISFHKTHSNTIRNILLCLYCLFLPQWPYTSPHKTHSDTFSFKEMYPSVYTDLELCCYSQDGPPGAQDIAMCANLTPQYYFQSITLNCPCKTHIFFSFTAHPLPRISTLLHDSFFMVNLQHRLLGSLPVP